MSNLIEEYKKIAIGNLRRYRKPQQKHFKI